MNEETKIDQVRWDVQHHCPFTGWQTWLSYAEEKDAEQECRRRLELKRHGAPRDWRVCPRKDS